MAAKTRKKRGSIPKAPEFSGVVGRREDPLGHRFLERDARAVSRTRELVTRIVHFRGYSIPPADRQDLVQEVMLQTWEAIRKPEFDFSRKFENFVQVVAARRCIDWMRTRKPASSMSPRIPHPGAGPLEKMMQKERVTLVREALDQLKESCRELIRLHVGEKKTYGQIAELLGRSEGALRVQMVQCIQQARKIVVRIMEAREPDRGKARTT